MTLHDEQMLARQVLNTVIEVFQGEAGFNNWFTALPVQEQLQLSLALMRFLKRDVRAIENHILGKEFTKDEPKDGETFS